MSRAPHGSSLAPVALVVLALALAPRAAEAADPGPVYAVDVSVDLDAGTYAGKEVVRFTNRSKGDVNVIFFNLYPNVGATTAAERALVVTSVLADGTPAPFSHQGAGLLVRLGADLEEGKTVALTLAFEGRATRLSPERTGLGAHVTDQVAVVLTPAERRPRRGSEQTVVSGDAMWLGAPFPVLSASRDDAWRRPVTAGDYELASASSYRISVTAPDGVDVVAPGARSGDGGQAFEGDAIRDVALFASRGYARRDGEASGVRLAVVAKPEHEPAAAAALATLARAVGLYSELYGRPPYADLTVVEAPLAPGTPSASASGVVAVASAYFVDMQGPEAKDLPGFVKDSTDLTKDELEFAVLRETARQWWGEAVGIDPQQEAYLGEGLATYSALVAIERERGAEGLAGAVEQRLRAPYRVFRMFGGQDDVAGRRAGELPNYFAYSAIVGSKSAMFVAALRKQLGDDKFFAGLARLYDAGAGEIVDQQDLEDALAPPAAKADRDAYDRLFARWIKQRHGDEDIGAPEYAVAVDPKVADEATKPDPDAQGAFERLGRFVGRKFAWFGKTAGKTAAKPF